MVDPSVIALAGIIVAGIAAIAAPFAAVKVALARNDHDRRQAAIDRRQRRREAAYRDVMTYLLRLRDGVARTMPFFTHDGDPGPPEPLSEDEVRRIEAEAGLHGSPAVLERLQSIATLGRTFYINVAMYQDLRQGHGGGQREAEGMSAGERMEAARQELYEAVRALQSLVNEELREE